MFGFVPLEGAMPAAVELRKTYLEEFKSFYEALDGNFEEKVQATISGAIVYAHYTTVFTDVYNEAQRLLFKVAKDETGRDSGNCLEAGRACYNLAAPWK